MLKGPGLASRACRQLWRQVRPSVPSVEAPSPEYLPPSFLCPILEPSRSLCTNKEPHRATLKAQSTHTRVIPAASSRHVASNPSPSWSPGSFRRKAKIYPTGASRAASTSSVAAEAALKPDTSDFAPSDGLSTPEIRDSTWSSQPARGRPSQPSDPPDSPPNVQGASAATWRRRRVSSRRQLELDIDRYNSPLRRPVQPENSPALYDDELDNSLKWKTGSRWTFVVPRNYVLAQDLTVLLDSLQDIRNNPDDTDNGPVFMETITQAKHLIWLNPKCPAHEPGNREAALYLVFKVAETFVLLDDDDMMDRLLALLSFALQNIGPIPRPCFHVLAAKLGGARRYDAVLKLHQVAQEHHGGIPDAEMLHFTLMALVEQSYRPDVTRYWERFRADNGKRLKVPRKTFDLLLRIQVRRQDSQQIHEVLEAMIEHGYILDARVWLTILRGYQDLRPNLTAMLDKGVVIWYSPTLKVVNSLLLRLLRQLDVDNALLVLRIFQIPVEDRISRLVNPRQTFPSVRDAVPQPNAMTYRIMTLLFARLGRPIEALSFFRSALSLFATKEPSEEDAQDLRMASVAVMRGYLNDRQPLRAIGFAAELFGLPFFARSDQEMAPGLHFDLPQNRPSVELTTQHYQLLLESTSALRSARSSKRVLVDLMKRNLPMDRLILVGLARLIFSTVDLDAAQSQQILEDLRLETKTPSQDTNFEDDSRSATLNSIVELVEHLGFRDRVVASSTHKTDLYKQDKRREGRMGEFGPTSDADHNLNSASKKDARDAMIQEEARDWLIRNSSPLSYDAPEADSKLGGVADDDSHLDQPLSPGAYAMKLRVYAVIRRDEAKAREVYEQMLRQGMRPTMMHIAPLIEGLAAIGKIEEAQQLKRNARYVVRCEPTLRIHTALIRAYVRANDDESARREIEELTKNGHHVNESIANIIEAAHVSRGSYALVGRQIDIKSVHSVAARFSSLMSMKRYMAAQKLIEKALSTHLPSDKVLHDIVRRSASYIAKEHDKVLARLSARGFSGLPEPKSRITVATKNADAGTSSTDDKQTEESDDAERRRTELTELFNLARASELAKKNTSRIAKYLGVNSRDRTNKMRLYRKDVVRLILDFVDGKLHKGTCADGADKKGKRSDRKRNRSERKGNRSDRKGKRRSKTKRGRKNEVSAEEQL